VTLFIEREDVPPSGDEGRHWMMTKVGPNLLASPAGTIWPA
jgi:hypothetical protein